MQGRSLDFRYPHSKYYTFHFLMKLNFYHLGNFGLLNGAF